MTRETAGDTVSAGMKSTSLANMVCQGRSAEYQTDSFVYSIETDTFPHHSLNESSSKCVNHNHLILISMSDSGEMSQQAPYTVLHNKIPKLIIGILTCMCSQNILLLKGTLLQFLHNLAWAPLNDLSLETAPMSLKPSNLALLMLDHYQPKPY